MGGNKGKGKEADRGVYGPVKDWGRTSKLIHGTRQYVLEEVTKWEAMGKFKDLGGRKGG